MPASPNGRVHATLRRLDQGTASLPQIAAWLNVPQPWPQGARKKLWKRMNWMVHEGLVMKSETRFIILPAGRDLLRELDDQAEALACPQSVRVFARPAASGERRAA